MVRLQTQGNKASYFTAKQGTEDALTAKEAAQNLGFPSSATIYFCVDYDVLMADVESKILPYFRSVKTALGNAYKIGAYVVPVTYVQSWLKWIFAPAVLYATCPPDSHTI